jgi:alkylation response protein AidB-like acyl-CoA dehydrogenase
LEWTDEVVARDRLLQRALYEGGYAGLTLSVEDGGQGLAPEYQQIFSEEAVGYRMPEIMGVAFNVVIPTLIVHGTREVRQRFIPPILRGEEVWCQLLSEPSGGSDLAGVLTKATRDGDTWIINGQKIWTSGGDQSDFGICLARTDPAVPKHSGLTMFAVPMHAPGVTIVPVQLLDGTVDFCQEYFDDVVIPLAHAIGDVNDGWRVAHTLIANERQAVGRGWLLSKTRPPAQGTAKHAIQLSTELADIARQRGRLGDPSVRALIGENWVLNAVLPHTMQRMTQSAAAGTLSPHATGIPRLMSGMIVKRKGEIAFEVAGPHSAAWSLDDPDGDKFGLARVSSHAIGGGTIEMARNGVAERFLELPREPAVDRDLPFNQLRTNTSATRASRTQGRARGSEAVE